MAVYGPWLEQVFDNYLTAQAVKVLVVTSAHVPDPDLAYRSQIANEASGTGYTAGGVTATGVVATYDTATNQLRIACDEIDFGIVQLADVGGFIFYADTGSAATDRLIVADMLTAPIEVDTASSLKYRPHTDGLIVATIGAP